MKPTQFIPARIVFAIAFLGISLALVSWDISRFGERYAQSISDTIPQPQKPEKPRKILDLDDVLAELNHIDLSAELDKMHRELADAMRKLETEKLKFDIDREKFQKELKDAMDKIDVDKLRAEIERSMASINWDHLKKELDETKRVHIDKMGDQMEQLEKQLRELGPQIKKELQETKEQVEKAKAEFAEFKNFVSDLEKEGLLKKSEPYSIRHESGRLTVNGQEVPPSVYQKHGKFLEKHKKFNIEKSAGDFNLDID